MRLLLCGKPPLVTEIEGMINASLPQAQVTCESAFESLIHALTAHDLDEDVGYDGAVLVLEPSNYQRIASVLGQHCLHIPLWVFAKDLAEDWQTPFYAAGAWQCLNSPEQTPRFDLLEQLHALRGNLTQQAQTIAVLRQSDPLTGLANRWMFTQTIQSVLQKRQHPNRSSALLLFNINRFKFFNDSYGHSLGDQLLIEIANRVKAVLRPRELFARIGGDEFALLITDLENSEVAHHIAKRIVDVIRPPVTIDGITLHVTISVGIAVHYHHSQAKALLRDADVAVSRSKKMGVNKITYYSQSQKDDFSKRYLMEERLRSAIAEEQLELYYQPLIEPQSSQVIGIEALLRWHDRQGDLREPFNFIHLAEETGLIHDIGYWVIDQSCHQLKQWQSHALTLSINISPNQMNNETLAKHLQDTLVRHDLCPSHLMVEITETALLSDTPEVISNMHSIREMGCTIALDDFGTGFSSIQHLRLFPINTVKIDKSLLQHSTQEKQAYQIIKALAAMLRTLELNVVIEGVETAEQLAVCQALQVWCCQGFYFDKPLPSANFSTKYLEASTGEH